MKSFLKVLPLMAITTLMLWSCGSDDEGESPKPAAAAFTTSSNGLAVTVKNTTAEDFTKAEWDFGDGTAVVENNSKEDVVYTYNEPGTYTITLSVTSDGGTTTATNDVTVAIPAQAAFTTDISELTVTVQNTTVDEFNRAEWDFGDGSAVVENNSTDPVDYTYSEDGEYTISLTVTSLAGSTTTTEVVTVAAATSINKNGGFEDGIDEFWSINDGSAQGGASTITLVDAPEGGNGNKSLKVEITTATTNNWEIEIVNEESGGAGWPADTEKAFKFSMRVHADQAGRLVYVTLGGPAPKFGDYNGANTFTLEQGWNDLEVIATNNNSDPGFIRLAAKLGFAENEGGTLHFDEFVVEETEIVE